MSLASEVRAQTVGSGNAIPPEQSPVSNSLSGATSDPREMWLVGTITNINQKLQNPGLDQTERTYLVSRLEHYEAALNSHRTQVQDYSISKKNLEADFSNSPVADVASTSNQLTEIFIRGKEDLARRQADAKQNAALWENYVKTKRSGDPELAAKAERELADYLIQMLERIDKKEYPATMSLEAAMKLIRAHPLANSDSTSFEAAKKKHDMIRVGLIALLGLPAVVLIGLALRRRKIAKESRR